MTSLITLLATDEIGETTVSTALVTLFTTLVPWETTLLKREETGGRIPAGVDVGMTLPAVPTDVGIPLETEFPIGD